MRAAEVCQWTQDSDGNWETGCANIHILIQGTPSENKMAFCCYCGKPLVEHPYKEDDDGNED